MEYNCDIPVFMGPLFVLVGAFALAAGAVVWGLPLPERFARLVARLWNIDSDEAAMRRLVLRILGPINGTVFVAVGFFVLWGSLNCAVPNLGIPDLRAPFAFTTWSGDIPFILFAVGIAVYNARALRGIIARLVHVLLLGGFAFSAGQGADFHVGIHAEQWSAIAFGCMPLHGRYLRSARRCASEAIRRRVPK